MASAPAAPSAPETAAAVATASASNSSGTVVATIVPIQAPVPAVSGAPTTSTAGPAAATVYASAIKPSTDAIRNPATVAALQQTFPHSGVAKRRKPRPMKTHDSQWATAKALAKEIAARAAQAKAAEPYPF